MAGIKDKIVTVESLSTLHEHNKETYMTKVDPIGSGTLSIDNIVLGGKVMLEYKPTEGILDFIFLDDEPNPVSDGDV